MANSRRAKSGHIDETIQDRTATSCVKALDNIIRLSKMSAATREAVDHLQDLAGLCGEANAVISEIKANLADENTIENPARVAEILGRLRQISQAVEDVNKRSDERIVDFRAVAS